MEPEVAQSELFLEVAVVNAHFSLESRAPNDQKDEDLLKRADTVIDSVEDAISKSRLTDRRSKTCRRQRLSCFGMHAGMSIFLNPFGMKSGHMVLHAQI